MVLLVFGSAKYILALWWECLTCAHALLRLSVRQSWLAPFFAVSLPKRFPEGCGHNRCNFALATCLCLYLVDCTYMQSRSPDLSNLFSQPYCVNMKAPKVAASKRVRWNSYSRLRLVRLWVLMNTAHGHGWLVHVIATTQYLNNSFVCSFIRTQRLLRCSASMEILLECMIQPQVISMVKVRMLNITVSLF